MPSSSAILVSQEGTPGSHEALGAESESVSNQWQVNLTLSGLEDGLKTGILRKAVEKN